MKPKKTTKTKTIPKKMTKTKPQKTKTKLQRMIKVTQRKMIKVKSRRMIKVTPRKMKMPKRQLKNKKEVVQKLRHLETLMRQVQKKTTVLLTMLNKKKAKKVSRDEQPTDVKDRNKS
jgi:hypothetical protein